MINLPYRSKFAISQTFLNQNNRYASGFHLGVDLVGLEDKSIYSIQDGTVIFMGYNSEFGFTVVVQQVDGLYCRYSHLQNILVENNQTVLSGETIIGVEGKTGNVYGGGDPRHLDLRISTLPYHSDNIDVYKNPCDYLGFPNELYFVVIPGGQMTISNKNVILCKSETDKRAAGYLADHLNCKVIDFDLLPPEVIDQVFENIYVIGSPDKPVSRAINIFGNDRYDTCLKVLNKITETQK